MEVIIQPTIDEGSKVAARMIRRLVREKPNAVLGLATGNTPLLLYKELIRMHWEENVDFSKITTFNLDEYVGLPHDHIASYNRFMWDNLFSHLNVNPKNIHIPDGLAKDIPQFCCDYEKAIAKAGGIDMQILGIGSNGHVGFNEPSSSLRSRTRIKTLTGETMTTNAKFFKSADEIPRHIITMGIGTIMEAHHCVLLAFGEAKAEAVACTVEGPMTAMVPASILQMHEKASVIADEAAASKLSRVNYYRTVWNLRPEWQRC